jgi:heme/copper-type cytochrome/quinol oxidase subunit 3
MTSQTDPTVKELAPTRAPAKKWSMALINLLLDTVLFFAVVFVVWVSVLMQVIFPPPTTAQGWKLWGMTFDQWRDAQFYSLCVAGVLAIEHLVLHWNWVCCAIATHILKSKSKPDEGSQAVYGVGTFIVILLLVFASLLAAKISVVQPR